MWPFCPRSPTTAWAPTRTRARWLAASPTRRPPPCPRRGPPPRGEEGGGGLQELVAKPGVTDAPAERARQLLKNPRCATEACLPRLSFVSADGHYTTGDELRGKVVLLSFWATWCGPCVAAMPDLK